MILISVVCTPLSTTRLDSAPATLPCSAVGVARIMKARAFDAAAHAQASVWGSHRGIQEILENWTWRASGPQATRIRWLAFVL